MGQAARECFPFAARFDATGVAARSRVRSARFGRADFASFTAASRSRSSLTCLRIVMRWRRCACTLAFHVPLSARRCASLNYMPVIEVVNSLAFSLVTF